MFKHTLIGAVTLAAAMTFAPQAEAQAQAPANQTPTIEGVIVVAPRVTYQTERRRYDRSDGSVLPYEITEATETVSTQGLDLNRTADLFVLEERIETAAKRICNQLQQKYPEGEPTMDVCVNRAVQDAMSQARRMTRAAVVGR